MPAETALAICSMIFGGVFERFPRLRVAFAHGGGAFPASIGRIQHGDVNARERAVGGAAVGGLGGRGRTTKMREGNV
jgi:hypothetical protein